jgi:DNA primase|tara:strand:- start:6702 stop:7844 length:1143 start_codon:yes stop_codon:yes gene_type:complete
MAKISPVSIKYMIYANFIAEGALEKPDVIGAIFGQTEGLLGTDLEMRELQKEGKIGRIEVDLERENKKTTGVIKIPTALDKSETTLIAAAVETIERIGPSDAQIEIEKIEDVRGSKRDYIIERAKKLMGEVHGSIESREISNEIKDHSRVEINEHGKEKLPCGDISGKELIVVEGRADVINLMKNGVKNVIAMNGTNLPEAIRELSEEKDLTLFVDGDRGGKLIARNVVDNANVKYITVAPDGKEVEELTGKEILTNLRKKVSVNEFFRKKGFSKSDSEEKILETNKELSDEEKEKLKEISDKNKGTGKAVLLDKDLNEIKKVSAKSLNVSLKKTENIYAIVIDGAVTQTVIKSAEEVDVQLITANNFSATSSKIRLLSL